MRLDFKSYFENIGGGSFVSSRWSNSDAEDKSLSGHPTQLDDIDFQGMQNKVDIPKIEKCGLVTRFEDKKNPLYIELDDGTKAFLTFDQYKRIQGHLPIVPKHTKLTIIFQRLPHDKTNGVSQIHLIKSNFIGNSGLAKQFNVALNSDAIMHPPV
jgi:hypothetical protein